MIRFTLAFLTLLLASLACMEPIATPTPTASPSPSATPAATRTATATLPPTEAASVTEAETVQVVVASVNVHKEADVNSEVIGYVYSGQDVVASCDGEFCLLEQPFGYVWRGCLSDNPDKLGCEAK